MACTWRRAADDFTLIQDRFMERFKHKRQLLLKVLNCYAVDIGRTFVGRYWFVGVVDPQTVFASNDSVIPAHRHYLVVRPDYVYNITHNGVLVGPFSCDDESSLRNLCEGLLNLEKEMEPRKTRTKRRQNGLEEMNSSSG